MRVLCSVHQELKKKKQKQTVEGSYDYLIVLFSLTDTLDLKYVFRRHRIATFILITDALDLTEMLHATTDIGFSLNQILDDKVNSYVTIVNTACFRYGCVPS